MQLSWALQVCMFTQECKPPPRPHLFMEELLGECEGSSLGFWFLLPMIMIFNQMVSVKCISAMAWGPGAGMPPWSLGSATGPLLTWSLPAPSSCCLWGGNAGTEGVHRVARAWWSWVVGELTSLWLSSVWPASSWWLLGTGGHPLQGEQQHLLPLVCKHHRAAICTFALSGAPSVGPCQAFP